MEERELFLRVQKGDKEARELLFHKNTGLIRHIVKRYLGRGCEAEDLFQLGAIGLLKAIEKFDPDYGVCFSTYAVPMIAGEMRRFLRDDGMVKVSRGIKENLWKIRRVSEELGQKLGRDVTLQELSKETGIAIEDIVIALDAGKDVESIYKTVYQSDGNEIYLLDQIGGKADSEGEQVLNRMLLDSLLEKLDGKERLLIQLRFCENQTQVETACRLGMTQVQVSRMEKKLLLRMRQQVNS
ncbi:MAG: SigB/SigF/SigG family RNA polymerase sigma factor [Lachnospiraceae bacterium]|nr:SigB/SigF/SigG family RNA polymerase sigma factor [Lachnospiraceae bacterium]